MIMWPAETSGNGAQTARRLLQWRRRLGFQMLHHENYRWLERAESCRRTLAQRETMSVSTAVFSHFLSQSLAQTLEMYNFTAFYFLF